MDFLKGVSQNWTASVTFRQLLANFSNTDRVEFVQFMEDIFFEELVWEQHCFEEIVQHAVMRDVLLWLLAGGQPSGETQGMLLADGVDRTGQKLQRLAIRLFATMFVPHRAFLERPASTHTHGETAMEQCLWDSGALKLDLLRHVPCTEDALQLARRVLLRHFERVELSTLEVAQLWPLGKWHLCRDAGLIGEGFKLLCGRWKALRVQPGLGGSVTSASHTWERREGEEALFTMFTDLEVWRLPPKDLLTPWVPGQILVSHVSAQCASMDETRRTLVEETRENLDEISHLNSTIKELTRRLEAVDSKSQAIMQQQADINDAVRQLR